MMAAVVFLVAAIVCTKVDWQYGKFGFWSCSVLAVLVLLAPFSKYFLSQFVIYEQKDHDSAWIPCPAIL